MCTCIQESLACLQKGYTDWVWFTNFILIENFQNKIEQLFRYNIKQWGKIETFNTLNDTSEYITLVQLTETLEMSVVLWVFLVYVYMIQTIRNHFLWQNNCWILSMHNQLMETFLQILSKFIMKEGMQTNPPPKYSFKISHIWLMFVIEYTWYAFVYFKNKLW